MRVSESESEIESESESQRGREGWRQGEGQASVDLSTCRFDYRWLLSGLGGVYRPPVSSVTETQTAVGPTSPRAADHDILLCTP